MVAYDADPGAKDIVPSLEALVARLATPRVVWVMVPSGAATDAVFETLTGLVASRDRSVALGVIHVGYVVVGYGLMGVAIGLIG